MTKREAAKFSKQRNQTMTNTAAKAAPYRGYVKTTDGSYYVQLPDDTEYGYSICSDDQTWAGGFGFDSWEAVAASAVPDEDKERLSWLLDQ